MNLIEVMKQALEALEESVLHQSKYATTCIRKHKEAINNLRAAIEEAEKQEPVLGVHIEGGKCAYTAFVRFDRVAVDGYYELFTHPAPAIPPVNWVANGAPPKYTPGKSSPAPAVAEKAEPVAWISEGGDVSRSKKYMDEMGFKCEPLYTHPAPKKGKDDNYGMPPEEREFYERGQDNTGCDV